MCWRLLTSPAMRPANLVFQDTVERIFVRNLYADIPRGIFLVRGENVLLLGEIVSTRTYGPASRLSGIRVLM